MKKFLVCSLFCLFLVSCENESPNDPYSPNNQERDYCYATFVSTAKNYVVQILIDGEPLYYYNSEGEFKNVILLPGETYHNYKIKNLSFSKEITFEYHKITSIEGSTYYYSKSVEKTIGKKSFKFYSNLDYKFTIRDDEVSSQSVYAE
ncbi:MAG: hypothetical protein ACI30B_03080 [Paludibacteraceae bacterium]